jgi:Ala-tRNA(Pro) deacylase
MVAAMLKEYLDTHHIKYTTIRHSPAVTSQEIAASAHISGRKMVKTVLVMIAGKLVMVVLPADEQITFDRLRQALGTTDVALASTEDFAERFALDEEGAMPPFGNLYGMEVYVSPDLAQDEIAFNAGDFRELIVMSYADFERLVQPKKLSPSAVHQGV